MNANTQKALKTLESDKVPHSKQFSSNLNGKSWRA